jgi:hypothetical protein
VRARERDLEQGLVRGLPDRGRRRPRERGETVELVEKRGELFIRLRG